VTDTIGGADSLRATLGVMTGIADFQAYRLPPGI
jgi:hypothetical protein